MKLPEDIGKHIYEIYSSEEMSEPLISVYTILQLMVASKSDEIIVAHDVKRYIANGNEQFFLPTAFGGDFLDDCIRRVFERDSLIQELFDCDFNSKNIRITVRDKENVSEVD